MEANTGVQRVLEDIRELMQPKENMSIVISSNTTDWTTTFSPPLYLNPQRKYELALVNLETYNSIPNITEANNKFVYSPDAGATWKLIALPHGSYEVAQINTEIQRQLAANGDWDPVANRHFIEVGANKSTLRAFIDIFHEEYEVNMRLSSLRALLGFDEGVLGKGYNEGENPVDINQVDSILVNCDIVSGSFRSGAQQPVIYSFFPNVSPGYKIVETPRNLVFLPVAQAGNIQRVRVWLADQKNSGRIRHEKGRRYDGS